MADLVVDTRDLRAAAATLRRIKQAAEAFGGRAGRAMSYVPALGQVAPAQAVESFLSEWLYGIGWIGVQAHWLAHLLEGAAVAYDAVEAGLSHNLQGRAAVPVPAALTAEPPPEPLRPTSGTQWGLLAASTSPVAAQLSSARHARDLIPGDPEFVAELARLLDAFAVAVADARTDLAFVNLGGWTSEAAAPVSEQLARVQKLLIAADNAFTTGAMAVGSYAREHAKAREDAASALMIWQAAEHASAVSRGAVVGGTMPVGVTGDMAEADLARAALKLSTAQQAWESAGRWLAGVLRDAEVGAPKDPGPVAVLVNAVHAAVRPVTNVIEVAGEGTKSAVVGVGEGLYGMGKGAVELGLLALNLVPTRAIYEPREYLDTWEGLWKGVAWAASNPGKFAALAIDLKTLQSDPPGGQASWCLSFC